MTENWLQAGQSCSNTAAYVAVLKVELPLWVLSFAAALVVNHPFWCMVIITTILNKNGMGEASLDLCPIISLTSLTNEKLDITVYFRFVSCSDIAVV